MADAAQGATAAPSSTAFRPSLNGSQKIITRDRVRPARTPARGIAVESRVVRPNTEIPIMSTKSHSASAPDVYARITNRVIEDLERGVRPWLKPWTVRPVGGHVARPLRHNAERYSGINVILLWSEAIARGFASSTWMTFRQAHELGGHVRKGETGSMVVYANHITKLETDENGQEVEREIPFLKAYTVFCVDQIDGLPDYYYVNLPTEAADDTHAGRIARADAFVAGTGAVIHTGGNRACYNPIADRIEMPPFASFRDTGTATAAENYYATLLHETVHYTAPPHRCNRELGKRFGDQAYAREELVAELGAAFLCADLGITPEPRADHAAYIGSWLTVLRTDKRAIVSAASLAQKAVDWLHAKASATTPSG
jgi:antirestriction protein ArdC